MNGLILAKILEAACLNRFFSVKALVCAFCATTSFYIDVKMVKHSRDRRHSPSAKSLPRFTFRNFLVAARGVRRAGAGQLCRVLTSRGPARGNVMNLCDKRTDYFCWGKWMLFNDPHLAFMLREAAPPHRCVNITEISYLKIDSIFCQV